MCGRFLFIEAGEMADIIATVKKKLEAKGIPQAVKTGEIFPTDVAPVITTDGPEAMVWGYPKAWGGGGVVFNTRTDALHKNIWRDSYEHRRCLVPTSGFYEWFHPGGNKTKGAPRFLFDWPDGGALYLAGLWAEARGSGGPALPHFSILTTEANATMDIGFAGERIHDRMPVVLRPGETAAWLAGGHPALLDRGDVLLRCEPA